MPDDPNLLRAVLENPDDDQPRLVFAAACEKTDPARAEFIRLQISLKRRSYDPLKPPVKDWQREAALVAKHRLAWSNGLSEWVQDFSFERGFVNWVALSAGMFLEMAPRIYAAAPVRHVDLVGVRELQSRVFASKHLQPLRSLGLDEQGLDDRSAELIARSVHLEELRWLSLRNNQITLKGVEAFARAELLPSLLTLRLDGNPSDPREQYGSDNDTITARWMPEEGQSLERMFGPKPWLHGAADTVGGWMRSRFA